MNSDIKNIWNAVNTLLNEVYPYKFTLKYGHYSMEAITDQVVFELIKENYKAHAERLPVSYYRNKYDPDSDIRKYTRAMQYIQYYRGLSNQEIEERFGFRLEDLETPDMSGLNRFLGYQITGQDYWFLKMQAECKLPDRLHNGQLALSKNVSNNTFVELFKKYEEMWDDLIPDVGDPEDVIEKTFFYFGQEEHLNIDFLYAITREAEKHGFPKDIPERRIRCVMKEIPFMPANEWCPNLFCATNTMLMYRDKYCKNFFTDSDDEWATQEMILCDTFRLKNVLFQRSGVNGLLETVHQCKKEELSDFILENYRIYDKRSKYEWTPERIRYYRRLAQTLIPAVPKPSIK